MAANKPGEMVVCMRVGHTGLELWSVHLAFDGFFTKSAFFLERILFFSEKNIVGITLTEGQHQIAVKVLFYLTLS